MFRKFILALMFVLCATAFKQEIRLLQVEDVCVAEQDACQNDEVCYGCIAEIGADYTEMEAEDIVLSCTLIKKWYNSIEFADPMVCDHITGGTLLSNLLYCAFDAYAMQSDPGCSILDTLAPTAAPTGAPTFMSSMSSASVPDARKLYNKLFPSLL